MKRTFVMIVVSCFIATAAMAATGQAVIKGTTEGSPVTGTVDLIEEKDGLAVNVSVSNVSPGKHGFHFHENGSCADEGKAAGGHYNPAQAPHGYLPKDGHEHAHAGDMGNIEVDEQGNGKLTLFMPGLTLGEGQYSLAGKSVILHEKTDDFGQPAGNAGGRIGCGIVEVAQPAE